MKSDDVRFVQASPEVEERIDDLLEQLTLEEKIDMLGGRDEPGNTLGIARLGIPALKMADGPMGVHWWCDASTAYPALIGLAASWDRDLGYAVGKGLGRDARARGVHILLAPGVNIYRSPLCGRNFEYLGEDPCLASWMVCGYICGVQDQGVAATVKHYAMNFQEYDRHGISTDADERTMREVYLPAFEAAIRAAGAGALMTAYNLVNGRHCSEHDWLINDVLKGEWEFDGLVMSDWVSTYCEVGAANGGLDLEMPHAKFLNREKLLPAIRNGLVTESVIDDKIRRMLRLMICFGWLDNEQQDTSIPMDDPETSAIALDVARAGCVLLKNAEGILPLDRAGIKKLAVIGSSAHPAEFVIGGGGSAYAPANHTVSLLEGITAAAGDDVEILYAAGPSPSRAATKYRTSQLVTPDGEPGLRGEYWDNAEFSGEATTTRVDPYVDCNWEGKPPADGLSAYGFSIRWTANIVPEKSGCHVFYACAGDGVFRLKLDGREISSTWDYEDGGVIAVEEELEAGRSYTIVLENKITRQWGRIHFGWEHAEAAALDNEIALAAAREADVVILCTGFNKATEGEGADRTFALPPALEAFIPQVAAANPNLVLALTAGGNVDMQPWLDKVKGLLHVWYPGQEGGTAVGELLFGDVNPSGKLPVTFEKRLEDRSSFDCYHDEDGDKRVLLKDGIFGGYRHFDRAQIEPQFPFGFGLSYTSFAYDKLRLSSDTIAPEGTLTVTFEITNTGARAGAESAQLYVSDVESSHPRPVKELKGFTKVQLEPGETQKASITLNMQAFRYFDPEWKQWIIEPGEFKIQIGASSADIRLTGAVEMQ